MCDGGAESKVARAKLIDCQTCLVCDSLYSSLQVSLRVVATASGQETLSSSLARLNWNERRLLRMIFARMLAVVGDDAVRLCCFCPLSPSCRRHMLLSARLLLYWLYVRRLRRTCSQCVAYELSRHADIGRRFARPLRHPFNVCRHQQPAKSTRLHAGTPWWF